METDDTKYIVERPTRTILHMQTAQLWSQRALCKRPDREIGCVITTGDMQTILSFGYNGPPRQMGNDACTGEKGDCGCMHAEINALLKCDYTIPGKLLFVTMAPCKLCAAAIAQAEIAQVYYCAPYRNIEGLELLAKCCVPVQQVLF